jgi:hypothetical protein
MWCLQWLLQQTPTTVGARSWQDFSIRKMSTAHARIAAMQQVGGTPDDIDTINGQRITWVQHNTLRNIQI